jgi:putative DNA primase/helicase
MNAENPFDALKVKREFEARNVLKENTELLVEVEAQMEWPDPAPLGDDLPPVPAFSLEFLPASFRPLVLDIAERMQVPMDFPGVAVIVALAGCVNRRAAMKPKRADDSWTVVPNLWGGIIAPPGFMKSPVLHSVTLPLVRIERGWHEDYEREAADYELQKEKVDLNRQAQRQQYKNAVMRGGSVPSLSASDLQPPAQKRLLVTDVTFEKLHEILGKNLAGVLMIRDELTGWVAGLDKPGREGERAFFLQAWGGDTPFFVDRVTRASIYVPAVCVSLIGNIQPARLRSYLADALAGGPNNDGLFQRFQLLVWPDPPKRWKLVDRRPDASAMAMAEKVFASLVNLPTESPVSMRFASAAQELFFAWLTELEGKIRGEHGLPPFLVAHLSKYRSLMPSLAALFELADCAASENLAGEISVSLDHAKQAAALCDYLESHAHRVYACVTSPECHAARELARHIQHGDLPLIFSTRSVYLKGWSALDTPARVRGALEVLADASWVRPVETLPSPTGGRPSEEWVTNPMVKEQGDAE